MINYMKNAFSTLQVLAARTFIFCLKNRHSNAILIILTILTISCGRVVNDKKNINALIHDENFLMMESHCSDSPSKDSKISKDIKELYYTTLRNSPQSFYFIDSRFYNFDTPLVLSLPKLEQSFAIIKKDPTSVQYGSELFHLFSSSRRYEEQRCAFKHLSLKKKYDFRPYLSLLGQCNKKFNGQDCNEAEYSEISSESESWAKDNTLELCKLFSEDSKCQNEIKQHQNSKTLGAMIKNYSKKFQEERFDPLFKLSSTHQKFNCQKVDNGTVMTIKVLDNTIDHDWLLELTQSVEEAWSRDNFSLRLELVKNDSADVVKIIPSNKGISYVPEKNNRLVYLSTKNSPAIMKRVLAHEFGHVLGFPDCYIEFFDDARKELVYYEISHQNTNIMCSLKNNVAVPDDYLTQLTQKSCLFN